MSSSSSSPGAGLRPKPADAVSDRMATPAKTSATIIITGSEWPNSRRGSARRPSPRMPPRPLGSGQRSVAGSEEASAVAPQAPTASRTTRSRAWSRRRRDSSVRPQQKTGGRIATTAMPTICMTRSATTAPAGPARLRTAPPAAWFQLGSWTDQVASARLTAPTPASSASPAEFGQAPAQELARGLGHEVDRRKRGDAHGRPGFSPMDRTGDRGDPRRRLSPDRASPGLRPGLTLGRYA